MDNNQETIEQIISLEWDMFASVNEGAEKASCQEDPVTFEGMRKAQFDAWSADAVTSYLDDLEKAQQSGRNLIAEKYIHMMETTEPAKYKALLSRIQIPSAIVRSLAREITDTLLKQTILLFELYPYVSNCGRPLNSAYDYGSVSVETYQFGELLTYSEKTLSKLKEHIESLESDDISLANTILENTVKFYGYESLDEAEAATKAHADESEIQVSFGCSACSDRECGI